MERKYQSKIMEIIHREAQALFEAGAIDEKRMAEYEQACLVSQTNKTFATVHPAPAPDAKPAAAVYACPL